MLLQPNGLDRYDAQGHVNLSLVQQLPAQCYSAFPNDVRFSSAEKERRLTTVGCCQTGGM